METVQTETLQAQGWEKWLPGSDSLGGTNCIKSLPFSRIAFLAAVSNSCRFMVFQFYQKVYAEQVQLPIL
jgi:hypothetical protein